MGQLTFFFDRCFGQKLPQLIKGAKPPFEVAWHDDKASGFAQDAPDDQWLSAVGKRGWIVLTHDKRFHMNSAALAAVREHKVGCFYMDGGTLPAWGKFVVFARAHNRVMGIVAKESRPYIYRLHNNGHIIPIKGVRDD